MTIRVDLSSLVEISDYKPQKQDDGYKSVTGRMLEPKDVMCFGIDPGVNFGITLIMNKVILICHGKLPKREYGWEHGVDAYDFIQTHFLNYPEGACFGIVEGAAYRDTYGQVGLESVRFAFYLGLLHRNVQVNIAAPATIRAAVLGGGKNTAFDRWPLLNHNAADSLGAALMAYSLV